MAEQSTEEALTWEQGLRARDHWKKAVNRVRSKENRTGPELIDWTKSRSLYIFNYHQFPRKQCRKIVEHRFFEWFILGMILLNCVSLAVQDVKNEEADINKLLDDAEYLFLAVFGLEMILKVIAFGFAFCGPNSYIRSGWNILDFIIVIVGFVGVIIQNAGDADSDVSAVKALRAFRVIRPLRLVSTLPSLQLVLNSILASIPELADVGLLLLFVLVVYSIIGMEFYSGTLDRSCQVDNSTFPTVNGSVVTPANLEVAGEDETCRRDSDCPPFHLCAKSRAPNDGVTSFNNAGLALLTVFQCITLEGWTSVLYYVNGGTDAADINWLYFVTLVIVGSFFVMNLVLGVLSGQFTKQGELAKMRKRHRKRKAKKRTMRQIRHYLKWFEMAPLLDPDDPDTVLPGDLTPYDREELATFSESDDDDGVEEEDEETTYQNVVWVIEVCLPDGSRHAVNVHPEYTVGEVRGTLLRMFDDDASRRHHIQSAFFLSPHDGRTLSESDRLEEIGLILRVDAEYEHIQRLGRYNRHVLLKYSTLQMFGRLGAIVKHKYFNLSVTFLVLLNTILLATSAETNGNSTAAEAFDIVEITFVCIFVMEIIVKMIGLGPNTFWESWFNRFDLLVIALSLLELILDQANVAKTVGISVLRCLRLLRVFRYMPKYWESMNDFITALIASFSSIMSLLLLVVIFMSIVALLGMQIFGGRYSPDKFDGEAPRTHFDEFFSALLTVFIVLTGEDWNSIMYQGIESYGGITDMGWVAIIFFCLLVIVGAFVLLNVFLAIAVKSLDDSLALKETRDQVHSDWSHFRKHVQLMDDDNFTARGLEYDINFDADSAEPNNVEQQALARERVANPTLPREAKLEVDFQAADPNELQHRNPYLMQPINDYNSLFCLGPENKFRRAVHNVAFDKRFDMFILLLIVLSSILLAAEDPYNEDAQINSDLETADFVFTTLFAIEMVMKIIALGLWPYIKDPWNDLDALVVIASIISLALSSYDVGAVRVLRVLRVLRPLRAIKRAPGLKHVVNCMITTVQKIGNVFIITFLFTFIFAVIGVQSFQDEFSYCTDDSVTRLDMCGNTSIASNSSSALNATVVTPYFNFDNVGSALLTMLAVSTLEGWIDIMYSAIDATGSGHQPERNHNPAAALFFVSYIIVVAFFMLNIFVGYVIVTFRDEGEAFFRLHQLDKNQRKCMDFAIKARPLRIYQARYRFQAGMVKIVEHIAFEIFIIAAIFGNSILLLMQHENMSSNFQDALDTGNLVFTIIFTVEAVIKLLAYGPTAYFNSSWNLFDFIIVVGSLVDVGLTDSTVSVGFLRLFRVARLLKLVTRLKSMQLMLWTFLQSFKALPYVALLIVMLFFMYAVIGMQVFGKVNYAPDGEINSDNNFRDFFSALLLLFRCATGENWQAIMRDADLSRPDCDPSVRGDCGSSFNVFYFCSFTILCNFLVLNLFVAVIMDNFEYLTQDPAVLGNHHLPAFLQEWAKIDPHGRGRVHHTAFVKMMRALEPPLGFGRNCPTRVVYRRMMKMNLPLALDGTVQLNAAILGICRLQLDILTDHSKGPITARNNELRWILKTMFNPTDQVLEELLPSDNTAHLTTGRLYAVLLLQRIYRDTKRERAVRQNTVFLPLNMESSAPSRPRTDDWEMGLGRSHAVNPLLHHRRGQQESTL